MTRIATVGTLASCSDPIVGGDPTFLIDGSPVAIVGVSTAGGIVTGPGAASITINGEVPVVAGDFVTPHQEGPHQAATIEDPVSPVTVS